MAPGKKVQPEEGFKEVRSSLVKGERNISIHQDAIGNIMISGDSNRVVIVYPEQTFPQQIPKPQLKITDNPYQGLQAFDTRDGNRFFGRERQGKRLWQQLYTLHKQESVIRILPIFGPSGSGKSSLAKAGLIPELARRPFSPSAPARVAVLTPGSHPIESLAAALARVATDDTFPAKRTREFSEELALANRTGNFDGLRRIADLLPGIEAPLILLIDQFEELYTLCDNTVEQNTFVSNLLDAASDRSKRVWVILTIRSDFLGKTQQHPILNRLLSEQGFLVPAMAPDELREAISKPAENANRPLDQATIYLLLEQTQGREGALPLLQFTLTRIWDEWSQNRFPSMILEELGGVGGALAKEAQRIYEELSEKEKDIARRIFIGLVHLNEGASDTRRHVEVESLISKQDSPARVYKVIHNFSACNVRLITLSSVNGKVIAEITHEALFAQWKQLGIWLDGKRASILQQRKIEAAAAEWHNQQRKRGYLLQGQQLKDAERFRQQQHEFLPLSQRAELFLHASVKQKRWSQLRAISLLISLSIIPALVLEIYLREAKVQSEKGVLSVSSPSNVSAVSKRDAVVYLAGGCSKIRALHSVYNSLPEQLVFMFDWFNERRFGNCRSLKSLNLANIDLSGVDLSYAELPAVNLSNADLTGAILNYATLTEATLVSATLHHAQLANANLHRADLSRSQATATNFDRAILEATNFTEAVHRTAKFRSAYLRQARFIKAQLVGTSLHGADLSHAIFDGANLDSASLKDTKLEGVSLSNAQLCNTEMPNGEIERRDCPNSF